MFCVKLSFIVAAYNVDDYIQDCLLSMLNLELNFDYEIIVIDDGSQDNTLSKINEILTEKIKVLSINNSGVSEVRNIGIELALGEYLYFIDGDDIVNKTDFEKITKKLTNNYDVIIGGFNKFDNDNIVIPNNSHDIVVDSSGKEILSKYFLKTISPSIWKCFFKKSLLKKFNLKFLKSITIAEDGEWFIRVLFYSKSIYYDNTLKIYNYRLRPGSVMLSEYSYRKFTDTLIVVKELIKNIKSYRISSNDRKIFDLYASSLLYNNIIMYKGVLGKKDLDEIKLVISALKISNFKSFIFLSLMRINSIIAIQFFRKYSLS